MTQALYAYMNNKTIKIFKKGGKVIISSKIKMKEKNNFLLLPDNNSKCNLVFCYSINLLK
jgi:hypothetical protein